VKPFDGPRLKIRRAKRHVEDARKEIEGFLSRRPYRLVIEAGPDPNSWHVVLRQDELVPYDIALIIGDAIHNLRSALDHMACELVRAKGKSDDDVVFPILKTNTKGNFGSIIKNSKIGRAGKDVVRLIRGLQPYPGGAGSAIAALHDIDIVDKHRLLVPTGKVMVPFPATTIIRGSTITLLLQDKPKLIEDGDILLRTEDVKSLTAGDELNASFNVAFATGTCLEGEPVTALLRELADYLAQVVEAFALLSVSGQHASLPRPFLPRQNVAALLEIK
jgi:hypothetical protein